MPTVIVRHRVRDFGRWIRGHAERSDLFSPAVSSFRTFRGSDDPYSVTLLMEVTDMSKLKQIVNDPQNDELKAQHTVLEPISVSVEVDA